LCLHDHTCCEPHFPPIQRELLTPILAELCWTEYRITFVFTVCCLIWYAVYCLNFSMNYVRKSSLLHKPAMYKIKLEEQETFRSDKAYSLLLWFVLLHSYKYVTVIVFISILLRACHLTMDFVLTSPI